jgi:hypothetical protein
LYRWQQIQRPNEVMMNVASGKKKDQRKLRASKKKLFEKKKKQKTPQKKHIKKTGISLVKY